ncbi:MAG: hypothetical protein AAB857_00300 [Patescibacteria group bacterium]
MDKIWYSNNLGTVGKWGGVSFLFGITITAFIFGGNLPLRAYVSETISTSPYPSTEFNLDLNPISKINDITAPVNDLINNAIKGLRFNQNVNIGTGGIPLSPKKSPSQNIDFSKFFSSSAVSSNDLTSFLKEAVVTGINLTILVISITTQVLKGILSVIK